MVKFTKTSIAKLLGSAGRKRESTGMTTSAASACRIYPSGVAAYVVDYRLEGSRAKRRVVLGKVDELTPQMARERAKEVEGRSPQRRGSRPGAARGSHPARGRDAAESQRHDGGEGRRGLPRSVRDNAIEAQRAQASVVERAAGGRVAASARRHARRYGARRTDRERTCKPSSRRRRNRAAVTCSAPSSDCRNGRGGQGVTSTSPLERVDPPAPPGGP